MFSAWEKPFAGSSKKAAPGQAKEAAQQLKELKAR